jgi:hypothetical protein
LLLRPISHRRTVPPYPPRKREDGNQQEFNAVPLPLMFLPVFNRLLASGLLASGLLASEEWSGSFWHDVR